MVHILGEEIRKGFVGTGSLHVNARVGTEPAEQVGQERHVPKLLQGRANRSCSTLTRQHEKQ